MASLRRSSVKLSSLGKSNGDLKMLISQLKTVRENYVSYSKAQEKAMDDMTKWSLKEDNRAIQDAVERFNDLCTLWFEAQREFAECFDDCRQNFKMILGGEQAVESAKSDFEAVEHREHKLAKELKKVSKKAGNLPNPPQEIIINLRDLQHKLDQASKDKQLFRNEANDRIKEQEATKMIRFKTAFNRLTVGFLDVSEKCDIVFSAGKEVVDQLPDVGDTDIHRVRYTGSGTTLKAVIKAKEQMKSFRSRTATRRAPLSQVQPAANGAAAAVNSETVTAKKKDKEDLPPPYAEVQPPRNPFYEASAPEQASGDCAQPTTSSRRRSSGCYMLNNSNSYPNSPAGRLSDTTTTVTSSAESSFIR